MVRSTKTILSNVSLVPLLHCVHFSSLEHRYDEKSRRLGEFNLNAFAPIGFQNFEPDDLNQWFIFSVVKLVRKVCYTRLSFAEIYIFIYKYKYTTTYYIFILCTVQKFVSGRILRPAFNRPLSVLLMFWPSVKIPRVSKVNEICIACCEKVIRDCDFPL